MGWSNGVSPSYFHSLAHRANFHPDVDADALLHLHDNAFAFDVLEAGLVELQEDIGPARRFTNV